MRALLDTSHEQLTGLAYMPAEHIPVLADELLALLDPAPGETVVDCTFGAGGHARLVAERIGAEGELICIDRDPGAESRCTELADAAQCRTRFLRAPFDRALATLAEEGVRAHAVYMDLGMSSLQLEAWSRGFSYAYDAPLDMRMDPEQELTAHDVVNEWPEARLAELIRREGEERYARTVARQLVRRRPLGTTSELVEAIKAGMPPEARFGGAHPARRTFQAIRIAVNDELGSLDRALPTAWSLLVEGGRFAAISFHSLEDRRVKRFLAERAGPLEMPPGYPLEPPPPEAELLVRRPVRPTAAEVEHNPRARAAKLRAARRLAGGRDA